MHSKPGDPSLRLLRQPGLHERRLELLNLITAAADEAPTVEEALRGTLEQLCAHQGWEAGRLELGEEAGDLHGRVLWHLVQPGNLLAYRKVAEARRNDGLMGHLLAGAGPVWSELSEGEVQGEIEATFTLPVFVRGRVFALLEFFAKRTQKPDAQTLEVIAFACAELGRILLRKPVDDALRRSEREYRMLFEQAHDGVLIVDPQDEVVLDANQRACTIYACARQDLIGLPLATLWSDAELERRRIREVLHGRGVRYEAVHQRKDGVSIVVETSAGPVDFRGRRAVWMANRDVTEKRRVVDALRVSEERYRLLFESSPQPMFVYDELTLRFLAVNEAAVRRYGYARDDLSNMSIADLRSADDAPSFDLGASEFEGAGTTVWRHRKSDGSIIDVEVVSHPIDFEGRRARLAVANDVTERLRAEERLWRAAFYDSLTGLPNRALFMERLGQAQARARGRGAAGYGVLFLDLDRFKFVNDSLGHRAGDALLVQIAQRLEHLRRVGDTVARLGGDEFAILVEGVKDAEDAARVAERVQRELSLPFSIGPEGAQQEIFSSASIGIALGATHDQRPEDLLRDADTAMYRAKSQGASQHAVFDITMHDRAVAVLQLEGDLRRAIERKELQVQYQPVVSLETGIIVGFEALSRWLHPRRGWVPPSEFIPMAEETGLIGAMDRNVLFEACTRIQELQRLHPGQEPLTISVNLSGRELLQLDLVEQVEAILVRTVVDPRTLRLEITETVMVENATAAERSLSRLRALGVRIALDDFGTGYSSLSYLHRMPIDVLKIDASFVQSMGTDEKNRRIVETIVALGKGLGIEVIAEGVEAATQAAQLMRMGCEKAQGYLFAAPMEAAEAERRLVAQELAGLTRAG